MNIARMSSLMILSILCKPSMLQAAERRKADPPKTPNIALRYAKIGACLGAGSGLLVGAAFGAGRGIEWAALNNGAKFRTAAWVGAFVGGTVGVVGGGVVGGVMGWEYGTSHQ
jgi:hypothetical protein